jgi:hypothetical protein
MGTLREGGVDVVFTLILSEPSEYASLGPSWGKGGEEGGSCGLAASTGIGGSARESALDWNRSGAGDTVTLYIASYRYIQGLDCVRTSIGTDSDWFV